MLRVLFFLVKISILVAIAIWVADRPGMVTFEWLDTTIKMPVGVFLVAALGVILLALFLYRIIRLVVDIPKSWSKYKAHNDREKGYRALTLGLTAVAAGDKKAAQYQSYRVSRLLKSKDPLPLLLEAQSARLQGDDAKASECFAGLLEHKDASFLGVRGLLQEALDLGAYEEALRLAEKALKMHPKQGWIVKISYDLQLRARDYSAALHTLYRAEKLGVIEGAVANKDRIAILIAQAEVLLAAGDNKAGIKKLDKAYGYDPAFVPTAVYLACDALEKGRRRRAVSIIEKAWRVSPHPDLACLWLEAEPEKAKDKPSERLKWAEKLLSLNTDSVEALLLAARVSMDHDMWGEARNYLTRAETVRPSVRVYKLYAKLEEASGQSEHAVRRWLEKAADAPMERVWVCQETGRQYARWSPIALPHGSFNTIVWDFPVSHERAHLFSNVIDVGLKPVIEAPKG